MTLISFIPSPKAELFGIPEEWHCVYNSICSFYFNPSSPKRQVLINSFAYIKARSIQELHRSYLWIQECSAATRKQSSHKHFWIPLPESTRRLYQKFYTKGNMRHFEGLSWVQVLIKIKISSLQDLANSCIQGNHTIFVATVIFKYACYKFHCAGPGQARKKFYKTAHTISSSNQGSSTTWAPPGSPYTFTPLYLLTAFPPFLPPEWSNFPTSHHQQCWSTEDQLHLNESFQLKLLEHPSRSSATHTVKSWTEQIIPEIHIATTEICDPNYYCTKSVSVSWPTLKIPLKITYNCADLQKYYSVFLLFEL